LSNIDIAVIEDDESGRRALKELLELLGYVTAAFASAEDFLRSNRLRDIACLITDVHLPGMSGVTLQRRLSSDGYRIPIIFITAFPQEVIRARVLADGALGYLSKPLQEEGLISCIEQAVQRPQRHPV
jgi:FixJ family two-component response regulator